MIHRVEIGGEPSFFKDQEGDTNRGQDNTQLKAGLKTLGM
ncbi:hypothetical protein LEP1GSC103_3351 [Leptospira borgpetersenii serovar Javanica str. UI 09931]|uniref:Uncharacterized protein n=3 Tax=Leptospira borgpetersenii TaxID=174 RepID=M3HNX8_LEPBO|nr:hypothetical protein LEP1GSC128_2612 [Leptospira borgpetersenii str. 200801926]EKQ93412.1 hypothetical protein LEP1GSC101_0012 [Leptospira borgpetersenii str. UI 09149]EMF99780.1 hypothetical protein LEP1GSC123_3236 [Leptospira borgpetersenii str. 200701203]EMK14166.1 hypothetical protein LEP1GSC066_2683 [Leptospira sp. serovar Kenya str. Sh9]EMN60281.1 hypothetical protein LEP1GSC090_3524 [Leptospira borgpetersenii serovar Javanica str. MK146]ENO65058.1 hypothetical protein LEP1GSC191_2153